MIEAGQGAIGTVDRFLTNSYRLPSVYSIWLSEGVTVTCEIVELLSLISLMRETGVQGR